MLQNQQLKSLTHCGLHTSCALHPPTENTDTAVPFLGGGELQLCPPHAALGFKPSEENGKPFFSLYPRIQQIREGRGKIPMMCWDFQSGFCSFHHMGNIEIRKNFLKLLKKRNHKYYCIFRMKYFLKISQIAVLIGIGKLVHSTIVLIFLKKNSFFIHLRSYQDYRTMIYKSFVLAELVYEEIKTNNPHILY